MFRTELDIQPSAAKLRLQDSVVCMGSCFADTIGNRLSSNKVNTLVNPAGVIYNPYSIGKLINYALGDKTPEKSTYLQNGEVYSNFDFHSRVSHTDIRDLETRISETLKGLKKFIIDAQWLILTFGTSVVYTRNDNKEIVANCHKVASNEFTKGMLTQKQILAIFLETYKSIMAANPGIQILLTVSPVRHLRDTLQINSISKAILRISTDTLSNEFENVHYFPSYEIMLDDLRDYRFYDRDMLHPSEEAHDYIWNKFVRSFGDEDFIDFVDKWKDIQKKLNHRPFYPSTNAHKRFLEKTLQQLKDLSELTNLDAEIARIQDQLND